MENLGPASPWKISTLGVDATLFLWPFTYQVTVSLPFQATAGNKGIFIFIEHTRRVRYNHIMHRRSPQEHILAFNHAAISHIINLIL
jgi:hypothetical protein